MERSSAKQRGSEAAARRARGRGFTLIELLVVVGIIIVLVAILVPTLARSRERARSTACFSNLRSIALWGLQYAQQFDNLLPTHGDTATNSWSEYSVSAGGNTYKDWYDKARTIYASDGKTVLQNGIFENASKATRSVFLCPSAAVVPLRPSPRYCNYGINTYLGGTRSTGGASPTLFPVPKSNLLRGDSFWFGDGRAFDSNGAWDFHPISSISYTANPSSLPADNYVGPWNWHNSESPFQGHTGFVNNFVFGDGHAEGLAEGTWVGWDQTKRRLFLADPRVMQ